ncbi:hypothetical protein M0L20_26100 [Spirosoma sp. RP8]|uniref:ParB N-terminal domain-containing protein n=1 Tax=Spirosoma liriopis TaxID=2937440 RepID=A0ABT0HV30_9BACT|nr:hypothetical protein [Spirosoma liriopis]MCK8495365.1 hypothetical protein [Spirosoma liriopis]
MKKFKTASGEPPVLHRNSANLMQNMLDEVKANITVLAEFKELIPPLQNIEYEQLKTNILKEGCREPLLIWQTTQGTVDGSIDTTPINVLIDGHNRFEICTQHNLNFKITLHDFATTQAVRDFMIDNQLGRRNLTPEQMSYLRGLKYRNERQIAGRPIQEATTPLEAKNGQGERTRDKLAKQFNVSPRTIMRDSDYSEGIDRLVPDLKQDVLKGKQKVSKEVIREIGRSVSAETAPLSLSDVMAITQTEQASAEPSDTTSDVSELMKQIVQIANSLDPNSAQFVSDCDQLLILVTKAKQHSR